MHEPIKQILTALSVETDDLYIQASHIIEDYALEAALHENQTVDIEVRPKFHWRLKKGKFSVEVYWLERQFIRVEGKWKRIHKHLPLRGKDTYPLKTFNKGPAWEIEAIAEAEKRLQTIRKRSRVLTKVGRTVSQYEKDFK